MPRPISVPGANGSTGTIELSRAERPLPSAAGLVQTVSTRAPLGQSEKNGEPARAAAEHGRIRRSFSKRAEGDHTGELGGSPARADTAEHAAAVGAGADGDVAAE